MRGATVEVKCQRCKQPFTARVADRKRGWGKFCSKSCKAIKQEQRTGQCADYHHRQRKHSDVYSGIKRDHFDDGLSFHFVEGGEMGHGQE